MEKKADINVGNKVEIIILIGVAIFLAVRIYKHNG